LSEAKDRNAWADEFGRSDEAEKTGGTEQRMSQVEFKHPVAGVTKAFGQEAFDELPLWMRVLSANWGGSGN
jgi:hypothetical protein